MKGVNVDRIAPPFDVASIDLHAQTRQLYSRCWVVALVVSLAGYSSTTLADCSYWMTARLRGRGYESCR